MLLSIEKLVYGGDGLARAPASADGRSMAVFVPFVLPGERVEAEIRPGRAGFARADVTGLVEASSDRIEPRCRYFRQCGGCHYQHIPYERQLEFKAQILRETFERVGKIRLKDEIRLHPSPPWNYRNRTRLQVRTSQESQFRDSEKSHEPRAASHEQGGDIPGAGSALQPTQSRPSGDSDFPPQHAKTARAGDPGFALGYYRFGSREFLPVQECPISSPLINRVIARLTELGGLGCPAAIEELELFADASDEQALGWAFCREDTPKKDLLRWAEALRAELPNLIGLSFFLARQHADEEGPAAGRVLAQSGAKSIRYRTASGEYQVSAGAFFQVNRHLVDELISVVIGDAEGDVAFDLYAGGGLFSVPLAEKFRHIFAVESSQTSFSDLKQNVPASVKVVGTQTEEYLRSAPVRKRPDLVVLDPPRAGVGKTVTRSLAELGARHIRYVSCDPATLARDLSQLVAAGYRIERAHLFDLFPQTFHIESVMLLER